MSIKPIYAIDEEHMDESATEYVRMFSNAIELQEGHIWEYGDLYYAGLKGWYIYCNQSEDCKRICPNDVKMCPTVWIPSQCQLQQKARHKDEDDLHLLFRFHDWLKGLMTQDTPIKSWCNMSMKQLWLIFIMDKEYNKNWNGREWISQRF